MNTARTILTLIISAASLTVSAQNNTVLRKEVYNSDKASEDAIGYAQAIKVGNTIYISGSVGWGGDG